MKRLIFVCILAFIVCAGRNSSSLSYKWREASVLVVTSMDRDISRSSSGIIVQDEYGKIFLLTAAHALLDPAFSYSYTSDTAYQHYTPYIAFIPDTSHKKDCVFIDLQVGLGNKVPIIFNKFSDLAIMALYDSTYTELQNIGITPIKASDINERYTWKLNDEVFFVGYPVSASIVENKFQKPFECPAGFSYSTQRSGRVLTGQDFFICVNARNELGFSGSPAIHNEKLIGLVTNFAECSSSEHPRDTARGVAGIMLFNRFTMMIAQLRAKINRY